MRRRRRRLVLKLVLAAAAVAVLAGLAVTGCKHIRLKKQSDAYAECGSDAGKNAENVQAVSGKNAEDVQSVSGKNTEDVQAVSGKNVDNAQAAGSESDYNLQAADMTVSGPGYGIQTGEAALNETVNALSAEQEESTEPTRLMEYSSISFGAATDNRTVVDVRICYSDGRDYCVAAAKQVIYADYAVGHIVLEITEEERLRLSSAIVDMAKYPGTVLYTTEYPKQYLGTRSVVNYTPAEEIIRLIYEDPNICEPESGYLDAGVRREYFMREGGGNKLESD